MKAHDTIGHLLRKATRANLSAQLLLEAGDADDACSRACYAMFDAARAVLLMVDEAASAGSYKTHAGVLGRFSEPLVKTGRVPVEPGRTLRRAETARVLADYRERPDNLLVTQGCRPLHPMNFTDLGPGPQQASVVPSLP